MATDPVTHADLRLVEATIEGERKERRLEMRRAADRLDHLELRQNRSERILVGENGVNGLAGDVKSLKTADRRWERIVWIVFSAAIGVIAYFARG